MASTLHRYDGDDLTVTWDQARCLHAAVCVRALPAVFNADRKPWVKPDAAAAVAVTRAVSCCPTGALHAYSAAGEALEPPPTEATVSVVPDGPFYVHADVTLSTPDGDVVHRDSRMALCRCGLSRHKPFCDNSHQGVFADDGTLAASDPTVETVGAELPITLQPNGPLNVRGPVRVVGADGASVCKAKVSLCRCGHSSRKPFCDGTHREIGFEAP